MQGSNFKANGRFTSRSARSQKGNGLLYAIIGTALLAATGAFAYSAYKDESVKTMVSQDIINAGDTAQGLQQVFGQNSDYGNQTTASVVQAGAVPRRLRVPSTNTAQNGFNQPITVAPANGTGTNDIMNVTWPVQKNACAKFVAGIDKFSRQITVNGVVVKPLDGRLDGAAAATNCDAVDPVPVIYAVGQYPSVSN